jgi:hypothetical protein
MSRSKSSPPRKAPPQPASPQHGSKLGDFRLEHLSLDAATAIGCAVLWIGTVASTNDSSTMPGLFDWMGALWALFGTTLLVLVGFKRLDIARHWSLVDSALSVWIVWQCASVAAVVGHGNVRLAMNGLLQSVTMAVIYWCVRGTACRPIDQKWFLAIALSAVTGLAAAGVYQRHVLQPREVAKYQSDPEAYLGPLASEYPAGSPQRFQLENRLKSTEPTAMFALTNSFAGLLATWLMVLIATRKKNPSPAERDRQPAPESLGVLTLLKYLAPVAIGILLGYTLLLTKSRTALLALMCGAALLACSQFGKWGLRTAVTLASIAAISVGLGLTLLALGVWDIEVFSESPKSVLYRLEYWYSSLRMIGEHPWLGVGPGNFQSAYARYKLPQASETVADPHNFVLEAMATTGLAGGICAMTALSLAIRKCLRSLAPAAHDANQTPFGSDDQAFDLWSSLLALALGFSLAVGASLLSQMTGPGNAEALMVVGLPSACIAFAILSPRIAAAKDLKIPVVAGVVVLLINLLGAGGWNFPSVASSLWLLFAVGANWNSPLQSGTDAVLRKPQSLPLATTAAMLIAGVWAIAATRLHVIPVVNSQMEVATAQSFLQMGDLDAAERAASEAERRDPWSDVPPATLAQVHWQRFLRKRNPADLEPFEAALLRRQSRSPRSAALRSQNGDFFAAAYRETGDRHWLKLANDTYREAHQRYPASAMLTIQLALAEYVSGNHAVAAELAEKGLEFDRQNPHLEQKLQAQKIAWLVPPSAKTPLDADLAKLLEKGRNSAEQIAIYLRSTAVTNEP